MKYKLLEAKNKFNSFYDYTLVPAEGKAEEKVKILCPIHGIYEQLGKDLHRYGCSKCGKIETNKSHIYKLDDIKRSIEKTNPGIFDLSKTLYFGMDEKIHAICKKHGAVSNYYCNFLRRQGCRLCNVEKINKKARYLYIAHTKDKIKIGISSNPKRRMRELRHASGLDFQLIYSLCVSNLTDLVLLENNFIRHLKSLGFKTPVYENSFKGWTETFVYQSSQTEWLINILISNKDKWNKPL